MPVSLSVSRCKLNQVPVFPVEGGIPLAAPLAMAQATSAGMPTSASTPSAMRGSQRQCGHTGPAGVTTAAGRGPCGASGTTERSHGTSAVPRRHRRSGLPPAQHTAHSMRPPRKGRTLYLITGPARLPSPSQNTPHACQPVSSHQGAAHTLESAITALRPVVSGGGEGERQGCSRPLFSGRGPRHSLPCSQGFPRRTSAQQLDIPGMS